MDQKYEHLQYMEASKSVYKHAKNMMQNEARKVLKHEVYKIITKQKKSVNETWSIGQNKTTFSSDQGPKTETKRATNLCKNGAK